MKYLLLTYLDEKAWGALPEAEQQRLMDGPRPHVEKLLAARKFLGGAPLHPTSEASTATVRDGKRLVTDGPYAETREQLGGYTLIEADSQDEAMEIAAAFFGPAGFPGSIEVRQVLEISGIPTH